MKKAARWEFKVSIIPPPGATKEDARAYIEDAVASMKGSLRPDGWDGPDSIADPLFYLDRDSVKATLIRKRSRLASSKKSA